MIKINILVTSLSCISESLTTKTTQTDLFIRPLTTFSRTSTEEYQLPLFVYLIWIQDTLRARETHMGC